jgi:lipopolysaccharide biosynthesis glycosyltransferase
MTHTIPVILCFDDRILTGAGVTILSLIGAAQPATAYDIHVMHPGLSKPTIAALTGLLDGTRHSIVFHEIPASRFDGVPKNKGSWTEIVYYRLLASEILPDMDKAIYSDVDVFVCRDLADVFATDLTDTEWAGVAAEANQPSTVMHRHFPENANPVIVFSGFMVMNLALMRTNDAVSRYFNTIRTIGTRLKFFDLDVLNIATPRIARVPFDYVVLEDVMETADVTQASDYTYLRSVYTAEELTVARNTPAIIHFAGPRGKPWQRQAVPPYYAAVMARLPPLLRRKTLRDWRKIWLSRKGRRALTTRHGG